MPELPEVEVVRTGIAATAVGRLVRTVVQRVPALRWPIPAHLPTTLTGRVLQAVDRRGKYLLLHFEPGCLLVHLGMSGTLSWRQADVPVRPHDHWDLVFQDGSLLRLNDPRRFGAVLWHGIDDGELIKHPRLACLGVEPFSEAFDAAMLYQASRQRRVAIKSLLLAGTVVVGVGNIYASESLFRAGIRPATPACRLTRSQCARLVPAIRATLQAAIAAGGSTLRDFVSSDGVSGYFQLESMVYGRDGQPCRVCGTPIQVSRAQQRATFWCPKCQS
jgi:formamidopyrimidine-DNA glycosylase